MFQIDLHQKEELEEDKESECKNYDISKASSYKACFLAKIEAEYMSAVNCSPPWFTNDYEKVCGGPLNSSEIDILGTLIYTHFDLRLIKYDLDSEEDAVANYMILSLQIDQPLPALQVR